MKNYKLPGLPKIPAVPPSTAKAPGRNTGMSKAGVLGENQAQPVQFGRASRAATRNPASSGGGLSSILSGNSSGSMGSALSGLAGFGSGVGMLISGFASLFGGGKTLPPALTAYQLPTSQNQNVSIGGSSVETTGIYGGPNAATPFNSQSNVIVQTVKQALLNSSSLNDVISEI